MKKGEQGVFPLSWDGGQHGVPGEVLSLFLALAGLSQPIFLYPATPMGHPPPPTPFRYTDLGFLEFWNGEQDGLVKGELRKAVVYDGNCFLYNLSWQNSS